MRNTILLISLTLISFCSATAQQIPAYSAEDIIRHTSGKDTVYIINFWATWCAPCVHELPEFNKLQGYYAGKPVKILMVSLDFKEDYPNKLAGFLRRIKLEPEVVWLSESDPNTFIPKIDNSWQGSIPATLIVQPGKGFKQFLEGIITEKKIRKIVDPLLH
jgi:thiol-disulfide isomerase/thioredoxin